MLNSLADALACPGVVNRFADEACCRGRACSTPTIQRGLFPKDLSFHKGDVYFSRLGDQLREVVSARMVARFLAASSRYGPLTSMHSLLKRMASEIFPIW